MTILLPVTGAKAATVTWLPSGPSTNDWTIGANWSGGNAPTNGDDVVITNLNVGVLLTNATASLSSIVLSNRCTLIFSNWDTSLSATNVTILSNATMTVPAAFRNDWMSNRVWVVCSNLALWGGANINVNGGGYLSGNGPGTPVTANEPAATHGGRGGSLRYTDLGALYGSVEAPLFPGSGGKTNNSAAQGGGAVRIEAAENVMINGIISANANDASGNYTGGGSGGSIYITCRTLTGTSGIARANGGSHGGNSGGGGGGRIAVVYNSAAQSNVTAPSVTFQTLPGSGSYPGDVGTLYFSDNQFLANPISHSGQWLVAGFTNFVTNALTIANASIGFPGESFLLDVAGNLTVSGSTARLWLGSNIFYGNTPYVSAATSGPTLRVGGNLIITNSAQLHVFGGYTNDAVAYGARIAVTGDIVVASGSSLLPHSRTNTSAAPLITARNVIVRSGGSITASSFGYCKRDGPGKASAASGGAGYGGKGGYSGGPTYGSSNAPTLPGSGGSVGTPSSYPQAARGGGLVRIEAESVQVDGSIAANGANGSGNGSGGASGGGIFIICNRFEGGGTLSANGGNNGGNAGGGGGGRIAVWFEARNIGALTQKLQENPAYSAWPAANLPLFTGTVSVAGGSGDVASNNGTNGTTMFIQVPPPGSVFTFR
ncbi:MAG: hypothetical protein HYV35_01015 [Lentisphaerae bacterium]|nr:hypothetical protein [Lentisphaerota bacterium]